MTSPECELQYIAAVSNNQVCMLYVRQPLPCHVCDSKVHTQHVTRASAGKSYIVQFNSIHAGCWKHW
jgi:hypothetical protein